MLEGFPPGLVLVLGAALLPAARGRLRHVLVVALPLVALVSCWRVAPGAGLDWLGESLLPCRPDALSRVFATAFCLVAALGGLFAVGRASVRELTAALAYAGGALIVVFAGDWLTLFVGWETMAVASTVVVWCGDTERARRSGLRYLALHVLGGMLLLSGIVLQFGATGSLEVGPWP